MRIRAFGISLLLAASSSAESQRPVVVWPERAPSLVLRPIGAGIEADHAAPAVLFGDTLAVWFERAESRVRVVQLRTGAARTFGRAGQGPLEFTAVGRVQHWVGDSALVLDEPQARATVLSIATGRGRVLRYFDVDSASGAQLAGRLASGALVTVLRSNNTQDGADGVVRISAQYRILARERVLDATIPFDGGSMVRLHMGNSASIMVAPVQINAPSVVGNGQLLWVSPRGDTLYRWRSATSRPFALAVKLPEQILPSAERSRIMDAWLTTLGASGERAKRLRAIVAIPASVPLTQRILAADDGRIWLRIARDASDQGASAMLELDDRGDVTRCFRLGARQRLFGLGRAVAVIGTRTDDDVYRVEAATLPAQCPVRGNMRRSP